MNFKTFVASVGGLDYPGDFAIRLNIVIEDLAHVGAGGGVVAGLQAGLDEAIVLALFFGKFPDGEDVIVCVHGFSGLQFYSMAGMNSARVSSRYRGS